MGLFSGIKKAVKKVIKGVKKVFQKVMKPFAKILGNKWVKGALIALTFWNGGSAILGAMQSAGTAGGGFLGMLKAGVGELIKIGARKLTAPVELISKGISGVGNLTGASSLNSFADSLNSGLNSAQQGLDNIFSHGGSAVPTPTAETTSVASETIGENIDLKGDVADQAGDTVTQAGDTSESLTSLEGQASDYVNAELNTTGVGESTITPNKIPQGIPSGEKSFFSSVKEMASGAVDWMQDNPVLTKLGGEMISGAFEPSPEDIAKANWEASYKAQNKYGLGSMGDAPNMDLRELQNLNRRNAELRDNAATGFRNLNQLPSPY